MSEHTEYDNDLKGVLFQNPKRDEEKDPDKKQKHPHYRGQCEIDGIKYWVAGWKRIAKKTKQPYMSLSFTVCEGQDSETSKSDDISDIPF